MFYLENTLLFSFLFWLAIALLASVVIKSLKDREWSCAILPALFLIPFFVPVEGVAIIMVGAFYMTFLFAGLLVVIAKKYGCIN